MVMSTRKAGMTGFVDAATERGWIKPRTGGVLKTIGVPVVVLGALVWIVVGLFRSGTAHPRLYAEFVDVSGGSYLDVQLDHSATSYGAFSAALPGRGRVWPADRVDTTPAGTGRLVTLRYDGLGYQEPNAQPDNLADEEPPVRKPSRQRVQLRLVGQVDPAQHSASADVWVNGDHHHIRSTGTPGGAEEVVNDFLAAVSDGNWGKLYSVEDPYMRNGMRRTQFVTAMATSGAGRDISAADATGPTAYSTTEAGVAYARVPVRLAYTRQIATTDVHANLVLVVNQGAWRVLTLE